MPESAKIQFTPAQSAAITARGGSLLVSAAAGSGKTRVLVERVVGLITDPIHPVEADSLLIMTFTNAAAAKLRADITTRLAEEVRAHPGDIRLRRQQLLLQRAAIGTVDAFCLHFVQQHFAALDVPPDFTTAEEAELARIEQETLSAVLESAYTDADFRALRTSTTGAAPTIPPATPCWSCTISAVLCPTRPRCCSSLPPCGSRTPRPRTPPGGRICWLSLCSALRVPAPCCRLRPAPPPKTKPPTLLHRRFAGGCRPRDLAVPGT